ncbi:MAG: XdhC family protein [Planctomycetes bacterium]|nr:XdhC family protein [Planctomycetota bacterium]
MDNIDLYRCAASALEAGRPVALVTVIATIGSTPGKVGYKMLVFGDGAGPVGTVGGGLLEAKMIAEAGRMLGQSQVGRFRFDLDGNADDEKGICGGSVEFLIETFDKAALPLFRELPARGDRNDSGVLVSILSQDGPPQKMCLTNVDQTEILGRAGLAPPQPPVSTRKMVGQAPPYEEIAAAIREVAATGSAGVRVSAGGVEAFVEPLARPPAVVLFGAGHVSYHIARFARATHFGVVVCDERAQYANRERFPDADEIVVADFGRVFERLHIDEHSYLVIVTQGHKCDQMVLEQAVRTGARYIGMIGSRRKTLTLLQKLRDRGVPQERLARVYSPIGVSIGAVTAEEIALSIVCELIKVRRLGDEAGLGHLSLSKGNEGR